MKKTISLLFALVFNATCFAGYFVAGEISYKCLSEFTFQITVQIYTPISYAEHPNVKINWGDGTSELVERVAKINLPGNISQNTYSYNGAGTGGIHTYMGWNTYIIRVEDTLRTDGIINIPNSGNTGFYIESLLVINPFLGDNNSPDFLNIPFGMTLVDSIFIYNPQAADIDGDSISYRLKPCSGSGIIGYTFPSASNIFSLDSLTGDLIWNAPITAGDFNIAMFIEEWRHGVKIGSVIRDMRIHVDGGTDVESYFDSPQFNVSPNPTHDIVYISGKSGIWKRIEIIDYTGKTVLQYNLSMKQTINIGGLPDGLYLIRFCNDKMIITKKIIKE